MPTIVSVLCVLCFFFSSRRRHTRSDRDWSSDVCSSDLGREEIETLENETDFVAAQLGARRVAQCREIVAVNQDFAARGLRQSADQVQERRQIGRASCRERVEMSEVGGAVQEKEGR